MQTLGYVERTIEMKPSFLLPLLALFACGPAFAMDKRTEVPLHLSRPAVIHAADRTTTLAAQMLGRDIAALRSGQLDLATELSDCAEECVVLDVQGGPLVRAVEAWAGVKLPALTCDWECYGRKTLSGQGRKLVVIYGSDVRGTVYGAVDLARTWGVSAWEWWADVTPRSKPFLHVSAGFVQSAEPSVQYRGIFLNDEDWGLQPWAAMTHEPETRDIGPKTYARIFELMWRMKANLIWPAMHESTRAFYLVPGNAETARDYAIFVGTSHAEPMMRNNVGEWDKQQSFNYIDNRQPVLDYWEARVKDLSERGLKNVVVTLGMRGVHDSGMHGIKSPEEAIEAVENTLQDQRAMLSRHLPEAPQSLTLYKEVLGLYRKGLRVPDDVVVVWPDDNYGYIRQLSNERERTRSGGGGVYYHVSYWGAPHDYLWLGSTHPALIRDQMQRAWDTGSNRLWVVNVGDIKPGEYLTNYFLDLAFDATLFEKDASAHLRGWMQEQFGPDAGSEAAGIMQDFYALAWERRPEFMGWSRIDPITWLEPSPLYLAGDAQRGIDRISAYTALIDRADALAEQVPADRKDAYFQLVHYPVRGAGSLNQRILKYDLANIRAGQGAIEEGTRLMNEARFAHWRIIEDTRRYNQQNNGKWAYMMDHAPRGLPVYSPYQSLGKQRTFMTFEQGRQYADRTLPPLPRTRPLMTASDRVVASGEWEASEFLGWRSKLNLPTRKEGASLAGIEPLSWRFQRNAADVTLRLTAVPTHPLTSDHGVRVAVAFDDGNPVWVDFAAPEWSDEWKGNVLSNNAVREISLADVPAGNHTLRVYAADPGVILNRIDIVERLP